MPPRPSLTIGRAWRIFLACGALAAGVGCDMPIEPPDDSLRGAGSIDVPSADLRFRPTPAPVSDPAPVSEEPDGPHPAQPGG